MRILCHSYINEHAQITSPGYITVEDGIIISLEKFHDKPDLDLQNLILFPGFVNAHCHLELTELPPLPAKPFVEWVKSLIKIQMANPNLNFAASAKQGSELLLKSGVTTIIDHMSPHTPVTQYAGLKTRIVAIAEVLGTNPKTGQHNLERQSKKEFLSIQKHISPHSIYGLAKTVLKSVLQNPKHHSIHISESPDEAQYYNSKDGPLKDFVDQLQGEYNFDGATPVQTLDSQGLTVTQSLIVHGNTLNDVDLKLLNQWQNNVVVHCPGSFAYFGYQDFALEKILANGLKIALGTDSLASNFALNYLQEIQLFLKMFPQLSLADLLPMITVNAAHALGLTQVGKIAVGYFADFVGFHNPTQDPLTHLKTRQEADFVMVQGITQIEHQKSH